MQIDTYETYQANQFLQLFLHQVGASEQPLFGLAMPSYSAQMIRQLGRAIQIGDPSLVGLVILSLCGLSIDTLMETLNGRQTEENSGTT